MKNIVFLVISIMTFSCFQAQQNGNNKIEIEIKEIPEKKDLEIENTKWEYLVSQDCINYIKFLTNDSIIIYYCEPDEKIFGTYFISNDSIIINTLKSEYDDDFPIDSSHRYEKSTFNMVKFSDTLISVNNDQIKYIKSKE